ncbi:MAG: hypothetical protein JOY56_00990 [Solirubrobacterales bacterium]|nr:hypothetical protein [Solirubrobacterales bacterium]MBV8949068.1 hypothetical protein [Solirubrobacterales bacterium]MBV9364967.1 hypothetical protein [Solirubrobacterales bacterium]MBV9682262.1 hypothetical protein [Solirubrobacterales bacterium]MBV9807164.1 hypothetical protein [Solirubrobacterales bacterium]
MATGVGVLQDKRLKGAYLADVGGDTAVLRVLRCGCGRARAGSIRAQAA